MNDNQKERLLKIAETNPELAKEMMDFMKEEKQSSQEPIAVKMVKAEEDKIEITAEQKKYAIGYIATPVVAFIIALILFIPSSGDRNSIFNGIAPFMIFVFITIGISWFCAYKAGMPAIKKFAAKHFKFTN